MVTESGVEPRRAPVPAREARRRREAAGRSRGLAAGDGLDETESLTALGLEAAAAAGRSLELDVVLRRAAEVIRAALDAAACGIFLWSAAERRFEPRQAVGAVGDAVLQDLFGRSLAPARDPLVASALERRAPVIRTAADRQPLLAGVRCGALGISLAVAVPIFLADRILALALAVDRSAQGGLVPRHLDRVRAVADAVAPAMDNARRYDEVCSLLREGRRLNRATAALLEMQNLDDVLTIICREARGLVAAEASAVLLAEGLADRPVCRTLGIDDESALRMVRHGGPAPRARTFRLRLEGRSLGTLLVVTGQRGLAETDLRQLEQFAGRAAMAIDHALLHARHEHLAALEERQKLAHELHDSVSQSLYGVSLFAEAAARFLTGGDVDRAATLLREVRDTSLAALREMRLLIFELRPPLLEREGLLAALQARLAAVEGRAGLKTELVARGADAVAAPVAAALYGICREALNNVLKHSEASRVVVRLERVGPRVELEVRDDGKGFDLSRARVKGGLGLSVMEERAARLGGCLTVSSRSGEGACVRVTMPAEPPIRPGQGGADERPDDQGAAGR